MKKQLLFLSILCFPFFLSAQLIPGDIAFTAFNADGGDDFAIVTFVDITANTSIRFTDTEWDGTNLVDGEADYEWNTGANAIVSGTIITFSNISENTRTVSIGSIIGEPGGLSGSSEAIFAYLGTERNPTTFIAAVANSASAYGSLKNTGLVEGLTAITYPSGTDIAQYKGIKTGLDKNGILLELNKLENYDIQDSGDDDHTDGIAPDTPFDTTSFSISTLDVTVPTVVSVEIVSATEIDVIFSEAIMQISAENSTNFSLNNGITISSIKYNTVNNTSTINHTGFTNGTSYQLTVNNIEDLASNTQTESYTSQSLLLNSLTSGLLITEIMYNAPSDDSNALEFIEIYNNTEGSIALGGIKVMDEGNFVYEFQEQTLASKRIILLATDKTTADAFYNQTFIDLPQGISNSLGNGGELLKIVNSDNTTIFEVEYDDSSPWPTAPDGDGPSLELLNPNTDATIGTNWKASENLIGQSIGENVFASPGTFTPVLNALPKINFEETTYSVSESENSVTIDIVLSSKATEDITAIVTLSLSLITASLIDDFNFSSETITIPANADTVSITIPITNDIDAEVDELFILEISNPKNAALGEDITTGIYILDDDTTIPSATNNLGISFVTSYLVDSDESAEIAAFDAKTQRLYSLNSTGEKLHILDFSDVNNITEISNIDLSSFGTDGPTSVATNGSFVAVSISNGTTADGVVVLMDMDGNNASSFTVGNLPDMVAFSPDNTKVLTANEGQPNGDYSIDPEGSISVIDITSGFGNIKQANVTNINFNAFDSEVDNLKSDNVRIFGANNATVSKDVEPEFITFSNDATKAWVSLQENNAIAEIDLTNNTIKTIWGLGLQDHSLVENTIDASDKTDFVFNANWNVKGMYMPDAIASYEVNGTTYIVTANEGDAREYDNLEEEVRVGDSEYVLDPTVYPNADLLKLDSNLGRLTVTNQNGDTDGDGDFDEIHVFGSRSFSIFNATNGALVFDSGNDFEKITANDSTYGTLFNASNSNNKFKNRSDNKGPEPEGVAIAEINGKVYAFITLERVGGFITYDITDPTNATFEMYINNRDLGDDEGGDLGPEGIIYIPANESPTDKGLVVLSNEVSATVSVYELENDVLSTKSVKTDTTFKFYPNPSNGNGTILFNKSVSAQLFNVQGKQILSQKEGNTLTLPNIAEGIYFLRINNSVMQKLIVK